MKSSMLALRKSTDGLYYFDYFSMLVLSSVPPGADWNKNMKAWFEHVIGLTANNLKNLEATGKLTELSKWAWFAHEFRSALERVPAEALKAFGLSLNAIPWTN